MERVRAWLGEPAYEPVEGASAEDAEAREERAASGEQPKSRFSAVEYSVFLLLGVSMLWAWNMFLAAGPYFQQRFHSNAWVVDNFQAAELSISTVANLGSMLVLTKLQANASYPKRIMASLAINSVVFILLALSTRIFLGVSAVGYFVFLMISVFATSLATGLCQNGIFAFVSGFGEGKYTQGIMTGQGIAGVLPCIAQIVLVLSVRPHGHGKPHKNPPPNIPAPAPVPGRAAFAYFLTATVISAITFIAFLYLLRRQRASPKPKLPEDTPSEPEDGDTSERKSVPLTTLFRKLAWLASAVFLNFAITMVFPIYTQQILSVHDPATSPPILHRPAFIPLAFLFWNTGDLIGRLITAVPALTMTRRPRLVFLLSVVRIVFVPLYMLCNVRGESATLWGDGFYLGFVQLFFGMSNGYIGSTCMMGAGEWVGPSEREAAGGFMGLCLVSGLAVGSLLSFFFT